MVTSHHPEKTLSRRLFGACLAVTLAAFGADALAEATCSITTVPSPAEISAGESVTFTGNISGKGRKSYVWDFDVDGDSGEPSSSTNQTETVVYANVGTFTVKLDGEASKDGPCTDSVIVTVNEGGGDYRKVTVSI